MAHAAAKTSLGAGGAFTRVLVLVVGGICLGACQGKDVSIPSQQGKLCDVMPIEAYCVQTRCVTHDEAVAEAREHLSYTAGSCTALIGRCGALRFTTVFEYRGADSLFFDETGRLVAARLGQYDPYEKMGCLGTARYGLIPACTSEVVEDPCLGLARRRTRG